MQQKRSIKYTCAAVIWFCLLLLVLLIPAKNLQTDNTIFLPGMDKVAHFVLFAILTFFVSKAFEERMISMKIWILLSALTLFGLITEILQIFIEDRNGNILDLGADILGIIAALILLNIVQDDKEYTFK